MSRHGLPRQLWARFRGLAKSVIDASARLRVPTVIPETVREIPHDASAFTQGLAIYDRWLFESTGSEGGSSIRRIARSDGQVCHLVPIPDDFAEGISILEHRLYQLSWRSGVARVFTIPDLTQAGVLHYEGEGWGLATIEGQLLMTDGSSIVQFLDHAFKSTRSLRVSSHRIPRWNLNDIEYANGFLYANVYGSTDLLEIRPSDGTVNRIIDCGSLRKAAPPDRAAAVMNGIAHDVTLGTFIVTGKYWDRYFEIVIPSV